MPACSMFCSIWRNWGSLEFEVGFLILPFCLRAGSSQGHRIVSRSGQTCALHVSHVVCLTCGLVYMMLPQPKLLQDQMELMLSSQLALVTNPSAVSAAKAAHICGT